MTAKPHFLCTFQKKIDGNGKTYFSGRLGNSRLLIYPDDQDLRLYLGQQIEVEKKSFYNRFRGTNGKPVDLEAVANLKS